MQSGALPKDITQALYRFVTAERKAAVLRAAYARIGVGNDNESTKVLCDAEAEVRKRRKSLKSTILKRLDEGAEIVQEDDGA